MADADLLQAEVWDDSALLDSWNEAFEEYKKYHSLAAKGEKVRLNIEKPASVVENGKIVTVVEAAPPEESSSERAGEARVTGGAQAGAMSTNATAATALPQAFLNTIQDDNLKNIMMSWYYAGYYTGLYEGKQQGYASAMQRQDG